MAWLEKKGEAFRIRFRSGGAKHPEDADSASVPTGIEERISSGASQ
jgi:hypothetical protein